MRLRDGIRALRGFPTPLIHSFLSFSLILFTESSLGLISSFVPFQTLYFLTLVEQAPLLQPWAEVGQGLCRILAGRAQDHKIVCVSDHYSALPLPGEVLGHSV
jgi:hypothetical protein